LATRDFQAKAPATADTTATHAQNRKKKRTPASIQDFYACNPKSAWYDTTTVNVHGKGFLQFIWLFPWRLAGRGPIFAFLRYGETFVSSLGRTRIAQGPRSQPYRQVFCWES